MNDCHNHDQSYSLENAESAVDREYVLPFDDGALIRLALGTAILISTLLVIPDSIAIAPSTRDALAWSVRVSGLWLTAFVQWTLGFFCILKVAGLINRGVIVDSKGIRLSRFQKRIEWTDVLALSGEARPFLSRLLFRDRMAVRMQLYVRKNAGYKVRIIDSIFFSGQQLDSLLSVIGNSSFGFVPHSEQVIVATAPMQSRMKNACQRSANKTRLFTLYITVMLLAFTGRTAVRNFCYNAAAQEFNKTNYAAAKRLCEVALHFDATYPYAYDRLARCEFRMKQPIEAEKHWRKALQMKPDLVSAKVGLSNVYMARRDYKAALSTLNNAVRLEPRDIPARLNLGYLDVQTGKPKEGIKHIEVAMQLAPDNSTVKLLAAQAFMSVGERVRAQELIASLQPERVEPEKQHLFTSIVNKLDEETAQ